MSYVSLVGDRRAGWADWGRRIAAARQAPAAGALLVAGAELFVAAAPQAASMAAPAKVRTIRCIKRTSAVGRCK